MTTVDNLKYDRNILRLFRNQKEYEIDLYLINPHYAKLRRNARKILNDIGVTMDGYCYELSDVDKTRMDDCSNALDIMSQICTSNIDLTSVGEYAEYAYNMKELDKIKNEILNINSAIDMIEIKKLFVNFKFKKLN